MSTNTKSFPFLKKKTNWFGFDCEMCESSNTLADCIRDLGVLIDTKIHFQQQVYNIFFQAIRLLGLIQAVTFSSSSLYSLLTVHCTSVRPSWNKPLLRGILSLLRMFVSWSTSSGRTYLFVNTVLPATQIAVAVLF